MTENIFRILIPIVVIAFGVMAIKDRKYHILKYGHRVSGDTAKVIGITLIILGVILLVVFLSRMPL